MNPNHRKKIFDIYVMSIIGQSSKKFAVLVGINYIGTSNQLNGCINDAENLKAILLDKFGYLPENVVMLRDDSSDSKVKPTKQNIINSFNLLLDKATKEGFTELWFSYSGHGSYEYDESGDEKDFYDEVICPVDLNSAGMIVDDFIYDSFISKLPANVTLFGLMDCCHSGTVFDLPYLYTTSITDNNNNKPAATVVSISGCRDNQTSADAYIGNSYEGAMSWSFANALNNANYNITLKNLVERMRVLLSNEQYTQVPMLAVSVSSDVDKYFITSNTSPSEPTPAPVEPAKKSIKFTMKTDYWYTESSWNVLSTKENKLVFTQDKKFTARYQKTETTVDLAPGVYKLQVKDSYGDGGVTSLVQNGLITLVSAKMTYGRFAEYTFTV